MSYEQVRIFLGGSELMGWTDMQLSRSKDSLTGTLSLSVFFGYVPSVPVISSAAAGTECLVYLGNTLAFTGQVDSRTGSGIRHGREGSKVYQAAPMEHTTNIGPNEYTIKLEIRGKAKKLVDSSHRHKTTNMLKPKTKQVVEELLRETDVPLKWLATDIELDKVRLRDGCIVVDELHRVASENAYYMFETRFGELCVTDDTQRIFGEPLILGKNILTFSATQSEDKSKEQVKVKGQRTKKNIRGKEALEKTFKIVKDSNALSKVPLIIQHYGDATDDALERRGKFELDKRTALSKQVTIEVFGVTQSNGAAWDIGQLHYVEVPPEGIFDVLECTNIEVSVDGKDTFKTSLTLAPPPSSGVSGGAGFLGSLMSISLDYEGLGASRKAALNFTVKPGDFPATWGPASLSVSLPPVATDIFNLVTQLINLSKELPPEKIQPRKDAAPSKVTA